MISSIPTGGPQTKRQNCLKSKRADHDTNAQQLNNKKTTNRFFVIDFIFITFCFI